eukprot:TRINITY_DN1557_c0_g1_i1.p1 TRINITY_DN1557_c0_g1~~TRINITY_DN1557_c0_g1_i1.p1  ORF type:complete len:713 (+),score=204.37 TRINITY_DN1557_c0_g1_i1:22-2160(+)
MSRLISVTNAFRLAAFFRSTLLRRQWYHSSCCLLNAVNSAQQQQSKASGHEKRRRKSGSTVSHSDQNIFTVIGLELHAQLLSKSKMFSGGSTFQGAPNESVALFDAAIPGTLPVLNAQCVWHALRTGLAFNGAIQPRSTFQRKHYFYCDLPHGFQITQQDEPVVRGGMIEWLEPSSGTAKKCRVTRIQIEHDSGKSLHLQENQTYIDLNRAGVGLLEIVTEPDLRTVEEAVGCVRSVSTILRHLGVCTGSMKEGHLRCDVNVSLCQNGKHWARVEIKNVNSILGLRRSIQFEMQRQRECLARGEAIERETRGYDYQSDQTYHLRSKEDLLDYRFLPEPNLPPLLLSEATVERARQSLPELPLAMAQRFQSQYHLTSSDARLIVGHPALVQFYLQLVHGQQQHDQSNKNSFSSSSLSTPIIRHPKKVSNWLLSVLMGRVRALFAQQITASPSASATPSISTSPSSSSSASSSSSSAPIVSTSSRILSEDHHQQHSSSRSSSSSSSSGHQDKSADQDSKNEDEEDDLFRLFSSSSSSASSSSSSMPMAHSRSFWNQLRWPPISVDRFGSLIDLVENGTISTRIGKQVLDLMLVDNDQRTPSEIVKDKGWAQVSDASVLKPICEEVFRKHATEVDEQVALINGVAKNRRQKRVVKGRAGFFVACAMELQPEANPSTLNEIITAMLTERAHAAQSSSNPSIAQSKKSAAPAPKHTD